MKKISIIVMIAIAAFMFPAMGVCAEETPGMSMHKPVNIIGATVKNLQGEMLGKITEVEYDKESGNISYAIISHVGIGEKLIPVPMNALTFTDNNNATLNITKEKLASAPSFEKGKRPDMSNRQWNEDTYRFYGIRPYWEEKGMKKMMEEKPMKKETEGGY